MSNEQKTETVSLISNKTLTEWITFARRDDCLDKMVPSELRELISFARYTDKKNHSLIEQLGAKERAKPFLEREAPLNGQWQKISLDYNNGLTYKTEAMNIITGVVIKSIELLDIKERHTTNITDVKFSSSSVFIPNEHWNAETNKFERIKGT